MNWSFVTSKFNIVVAHPQGFFLGLVVQRKREEIVQGKEEDTITTTTTASEEEEEEPIGCGISEIIFFYNDPRVSFI